MDKCDLMRLASLERQVRGWKLFGVLLVVALAGAILVGRAAPQDNQFIIPAKHSKVVTEDFVLVGSDGREYAHLYTKNNHPVFEFYDSKHNVIWSGPQAGFRPVEGQER